MNASIIDSNRFAPYGEALDPVAKNARLTNSPFGYTGESHDIEGGLVYLRARYYEPETMRFLQQDTELGDIKNPLTRNLYAYAGGNPLTYVDPTGNWAVEKNYKGNLHYNSESDYSSGDDVIVIQKYLSAVGYLNIKDSNGTRISYTGNYKSITKNKVTQLQKAFGLKETGTVNAETWAGLSLPAPKSMEYDYILRFWEPLKYDAFGALYRATRDMGNTKNFIGPVQPPKGAGKTDNVDLSKLKPEDVTRTIAEYLIANPAAVYATQHGWLMDLFWAAGFVRDDDGVYHARQDALQQYGGYNSLYDMIFDYATSMKPAISQFTYNGQDYRLWAWKGDYLNLGAGAELGLYSRLSVLGNQTDHWLADTSSKLTMTLNLIDNKGNPIANYNPSAPQWWITAFNPNYQNVQAENLTATYTVNFEKDKGMYNAFINSDAFKGDKRWSISPNDKNVLIFNFNGKEN